MGVEARALLAHGLAPSTARNYAGAQHRYLHFAALHGLTPPLPASADAVCLWAAYLARSVSHSTVRHYLYGLRSLHIDMDWADPLVGPRLARLLAGIRRTELNAERRSTVTLAVTATIAARLLAWLPARSLEHRAVRAAIAIGVDALLRPGELVPEDVPGAGTPEHRRLLRFGDVAVQRSSDGSLLGFVLSLRLTKTRQFGGLAERAFVTAPWAVRELGDYLAMRGSHEGNGAQLLQLADGAPLLRRTLLDVCYTALAAACGMVHGVAFDRISFRSGGATDLAARGAPELTLKTLGRWRSDAYRFYLRPDTQSAFAAAAALSR